ARQLFEKAIALDPKYGQAYVALGATYWIERDWRWNAAPQTLERALALAQQAIALDDALAGAHGLLGFVYREEIQYEQAIVEMERAIALDRNGADSYPRLDNILNVAGRPEEAIGLVEKALRLNPHYPAWYLLDLGHAYRMTGRYTEAIATLKNLVV